MYRSVLATIAPPLLKKELEAFFNRFDSLSLAGDIRDEYDFLAKNGQVELLRQLNFQQVKVRGRFPMYYAAENGHLQTIACLLDSGYSPETKPRKNGHSPLTIAIINRNHRIAELMIEFITNINAPGKDLVTPLEEAVRVGNLRLVKLLLARGATPENPYTDKHRPALFTAIQNQHIEIVKVILWYGVDLGKPFRKTVLQHTIRFGNLEIFKLLILNGANIFTSGSNGGSLLHEAVIHGTVDMVTFLIEKGFDINKEDRWGRTPLAWAKIGGDRRMISQLEK